MKGEIKYDLRTALESGVRMHPQADVHCLGMKVLAYEPFESSDIVVMEVEWEPPLAELPSYIEFSEAGRVTVEKIKEVLAQKV